MTRGLLTAAVMIIAVPFTTGASEPAALTAGPTAATAAPSLVNVGDRLRYQVAEDGDAPVDLIVSNAGTLDLPYFGPIVAAGKTLPALLADIKEALEQDLYVTATVRLTVTEFHTRAINRGRVHLTGQVRKLGPFDIDMSERNTLGRTILAAGGLSDFADDRKVRVVRKDPATGGFKTIVVDLKEVLEKGRIEKDLELQDGDFIIVDEKIIKW